VKDTPMLRTGGATGRSSLSSALHWMFSGPLLAPIIAFIASAIVAVGPWLITVLALTFISLTLSPVLGRGAIEDLRLSIAYAFGIALFATAPLAALTARLVRRNVEDQGGQLVPELYAICLLVSGLGAQALALSAVFAFGITPVKLSVAFVVLATTGSLMFTSSAMLMALRRYWQLVNSFVIGTLLALLCALLSSGRTPAMEILIWSFSLGLWISHELMFSSTTRRAGITMAGLAKAFAAIRQEIHRSRILLFGIAFAMLGVWADKWVYWFSSIGMTAPSGLYHFAPYDSAMFIAHLSMAPTLTAWFLFQERVLEPRAQRFWRLIEQRPTRSALAAEAAGLQELVWRNVFQILFIQVGCSAVLIMLSPNIIRGLSMRFDQIELLQIGIVAVLLQSLFFLCSTILLLCNKNTIFFRINLYFIIMNIVMGVIFFEIFGVSAYGVFIASLICGVTSFVFTHRALSELVFIVFIKENSDLYAKQSLPIPNLIRGVTAALTRRLSGRRRTYES
jgi:polysaccharide biosynthesis protein PelG